MHITATKRFGVSQLPKANDAAKMPPSIAIGAWHLQAPKTSSLKRLVPIFIWPRVGHHRPIQNKVICVDIVMAKPKLVLHIVGRTELFLRPFVTWIVNVMFASVTLWYAQNPCIGLHCPLPFGRGGGNIAMCHLEGKQPTFNTNVVYATPCFIQLNDFCMCRGIA